MRVFAFLSLLVVAAACSGEGAREPNTPATTRDAGASDAASTSDGAATAPLPYPAGPYGTSIGDVMPDFDVLGYALSRDARDPTRLPFRRVHASELRDGRCECLVALWDVSGFKCPWSALAGQTLSDAVDNDPTFCAIEVLDGNFDTIRDGVPGSMAPTTRADLDAFTSAARQNYPVGIVTSSTRRVLNGDAVYSFPVSFIIDARTMRLIEVQPGLTTNFVERAKQTCRASKSVLEPLASGLAPHAIAVTSQGLFVADESGLLRFPLAGGSPTKIGGVTKPTALAHRGDVVVWIAGNEVGRVDGDVGTVLATAPAEHRGITTDDAHVYVTRVDGVVASVPIAGGPIVEVRKGETAPTSIAVTDTDVVFFSSGTKEVVRSPKDGSSRTKVAWSTPVGMSEAALPVNVTTWSDLGFGVVLRERDVEAIVPIANKVVPGALDVFVLQGQFSSLALEPTRFVGALARNGAGVVFDQPQDSTPPNESRLAPGQTNVVGVAANATHVYWATGESASGAKDGALRRRTR